MQINKYMQMAYNLALTCYNNKLDVPVGCVIVNNNGNVIAQAFNTCVANNNPTLHAEMLAINQACQFLQTNKLNSCTLYTTLEPCLMCTGAIMNARINNIYFGAFDENYGCLESNKILLNKLIPYKPNVYGGLMQQQCKQLITDFFKQLRNA